MFQFPTGSYPTREAHLRAAAEVLAPEYKVVVDAGFNLQLDSPDVAMACHCVVDGQAISDPVAHVEAGSSIRGWSPSGSSGSPGSSVESA